MIHFHILIKMLYLSFYIKLNFEIPENSVGIPEFR